MFRKLILLLVSTLGSFSSAVFAVGLGEYELNSGLNQPLNAQIKLLSAGDLGDHEIQASLASMAEFEKVGIDRLYFLNNIKFETTRGDDGQIHIGLSTREPIKEPFLNFLVELNWPNGRIIREYTFLLDPPVFDETTSSTIQQSETSQQTTTPTPAPRQTAAPPQREASYSGDTYGPVSGSDTLWSIASSVRPADASIHQTLVAIYRANPDAFANGNINNLLKGKVLVIPDSNLIAQVPHRAALQDVVMQNRQWQSGGARRVVDSGDRSTSTDMGSDARLTLSSPDEQGEGSGGSGSDTANARLNQVEDKLAQAQETSATLQAENEELRTRLADALKKIEMQQSGSPVEIADTELAVLSNQQEESESGSDLNAGDTSEAADELTTSDTTDSSASDIADTESTDESGTSDITQSDATDAADTSAADTATTTQQQTATKPVIPEPVPSQPKGFLEQVMENSALLWGGIAAIVILIFAVFWRMRKRMEQDEFQDDLVASAAGGSLDSTESFELPEVGDDMLVELDMDDEDAEVSDADDENFDPLGEADIYIAYGKYEQAESLLLEAIEDNPVRADLKVKLMECYAENEDKEKFDSLAEEVSQAPDAGEWEEQVNSLREQGWPGDAGDGDEDVTETFDLPSTEDIFGDDDFSSTDADSESDEGFDLGGDSLGLDDEDSEEFDIDMDLGGDEDDSAVEAKAETGEDTDVTQTFDSLDDDDFSLDDDFSDTLDEEAPEETADNLLDDEEDSISLDDSDDISLDLDDDDFDFEDESEFEDEAAEDSGDEIATKLDLARAYIDMGDSEGAKEILSEVVAEGTDSQKAEAEALIKKAD